MCVCVSVYVSMYNYLCCSSVNLSFVWILNAKNIQPYMGVPKCTSCHKAIMAMTARAFLNKIIQIIHIYIYIYIPDF